MSIANATVTVERVNKAPTIASLAGDTLTYTEGSGAQRIDQGTAATLTDVDSANFDGGNLTVTITSGEDAAEDRLNFGGGVAFGGGFEMDRPAAQCGRRHSQLAKRTVRKVAIS